MKELIARLEKATGPSGNLDLEIATACGIKWSADEDGEFGGYGIMPRRVRFTASIEAALTLVPDSWKLCLWTENGLVEAYQIKGVKRPAGIRFRIQGHDLPLAICIAALQARLALTDAGREP